MQLTLQKRLSRGFQLGANHTFSKAIDDSSDFVQAQQPSNPHKARAERSLSIENQRQRFTMTGPYRGVILGKWILFTRWVFRSGTPENVRVGSDVNGDGNSTDRPFNGIYELGRNTLEALGSATVDVRWPNEFRSASESI